MSAGQQLCVVCHDVANGIHFGAITCEGCKVRAGVGDLFLSRLTAYSLDGSARP